MINSENSQEDCNSPELEAESPPEAPEKMELFKCHKKVRAAKVGKIEGCDITLIHQNGAESIKTVSPKFIARHNLNKDCYLVEYEDGYLSVSPAPAFENGYSPSSEGEGNLVAHAKREFLRAGYTPLDQEQDDDPNKWIQENVLELMEVFSNQDHSGFSAGFCIGYFNDLAKYKLITPIQSAEELCFADVGISSMEQSRAISAVFQDFQGEYYIEAVVFRDQDGVTFSGNLSDEVNVSSAQYIKYPFMPKTFIIDITREEVAKDDWGNWKLVDPSQLDAVRDYYSGNIT